MGITTKRWADTYIIGWEEGGERAMTTERDAELTLLWNALWDDLRHNATGQITGFAIIDKHRPRIEAALRAQGDSASTPYDWELNEGYNGLRIPQLDQRASTTTEGAVLDVNVLARALIDIATRDDPLGEHEVIVSVALEPDDPQVMASLIADAYSRALLVDVPDEHASGAWERDPESDDERHILNGPDDRGTLVVYGNREYADFILAALSAASGTGAGESQS